MGMFCDLHQVSWMRRPGPDSTDRNHIRFIGEHPETLLPAGHNRFAELDDLFGSPESRRNDFESATTARRRKSPLTLSGMVGNMKHGGRAPVRSAVALIALFIVSVAGCASSPAPGVSGLRVGTGYSSSQSDVTGTSSTFAVGQSLYVAFTVTATNAGTADVMLERGSLTEDTSLPIDVRSGSHTYDAQFTVSAPGTVTVVVSYGGVADATDQISVGG